MKSAIKDPKKKNKKMSVFYLRSMRKKWIHVCAICGEEKPISRIIGVCKDCLKSHFNEAIDYIVNAHKIARKPYGLPLHPPKSADGFKCTLCANECILGPGDVGFCGLRWNENGKLVSLSTAKRGVLYAYWDPHVTNCCAAWFCPAGTGLGYPEYAVRPGPEYGYYNYAIFFYGCNFDCLFCQNFSHKRISEGLIVSAQDLARRILDNHKCTCICYFGGSPEPQLPYSINVNRIILEEKPENRILRICYEWNGAGNPTLVRKVAEQVLVSGGIIKFDLKAFSPEIYYALTGVKARDQVFKNFEMIYHEFYNDRKEIPILTATTLLVPGYVDANEVEQIAKFIAELDPNIPYSLLIFHPDFMMTDLPVTPKKQVWDCYQAAKKYLKRVHVGNIFLLDVAPATI